MEKSIKNKIHKVIIASNTSSKIVFLNTISHQKEQGFLREMTDSRDDWDGRNTGRLRTSYSRRRKRLNIDRVIWKHAGAGLKTLPLATSWTI